MCEQLNMKQQQKKVVLEGKKSLLCLKKKGGGERERKGERFCFANTQPMSPAVFGGCMQCSTCWKGEREENCVCLSLKNRAAAAEAAAAAGKERSDPSSYVMDPPSSPFSLERQVCVCVCMHAANTPPPTPTRQSVPLL